jgi:hypothetical protein
MLVPRLLASSALWVRIQTFLKKYKMGDISKGVANTLASKKKKILARRDHHHNVTVWRIRGQWIDPYHPSLLAESGFAVKGLRILNQNSSFTNKFWLKIGQIRVSRHFLFYIHRFKKDRSDHSNLNLHRSDPLAIGL